MAGKKAEEPKEEPKVEEAQDKEIPSPVFDEAQKKGYFGERVDETPLDHYTVEGQTKGERGNTEE